MPTIAQLSAERDNLFAAQKGNVGSGRAQREEDSTPIPQHGTYGIITDLAEEIITKGL